MAARWFPTFAPFVFSFAVAVAAGGSGCGSKGDEVPRPPERNDVAYLTPTQHLVRTSMALRGVRPSVDDLREVNGDPAALERIVDGYLKTAAFGETIRDLHAEAWLVRVAPAIYPAGFPARGALKGMDVQKINLSLTEAPLRLIEHVVMNDRPYSEIVTADYTFADGIVSTVWGTPHLGGIYDWEKTRWTDGRPAAGILSDSMIFTRHSTTYSNSNRGRANAVSKALLCYDFLDREIRADASINLSDPIEVANAVRKNTACAGCHQSLDPLASYFGAFHPLYVPAFITDYPVRHFLPPLVSVFTVTEPAYFGQRGNGLAFLGGMIAQDPRFSLCAAKRFYAWFNQVRVEDVPLRRASDLQRIFVDNGMSAKALARAVVLSDDFRASHALTDEGAADVLGWRKVRPRELARLIEDLTGFRWQTNLPFDLGTGNIGRIDLMTDALFGFDVLAGGIDGINVTLPSHTVSASTSLVFRALAAQAAPFVVASDFAMSSRPARRLLTRVSENDTSEATVRAQLADLELRLYGDFVEPNDPAVDASYALFRDALRAGGDDVRRAWATTLFAMLQDPRVAYY